MHSEEIRSDGTIGAQNQTPYHGISGIQHPIRVSPDGSIVILGSGLIFDAIDLTRIGSLSNNIDDAVWESNALFTMRSIGNNKCQIQKWDVCANYKIVDARQLSGIPIKMFPISNGVLVVSELNGKTNLTTLEF
ncbi:MAG: hypothetical protein H0T62_11350 [Parachlamydiaceae bacterium]|nr:hypothetical protein [Parachlamydiaceae bacterium]